MSPVDLSGPFRGPATWRQLWRWAGERVWRIEHAFERSRAEGKAVDDARLRIFMICGLFGLAFVTLGLEAGRAALFSKAGSGAASATTPGQTRADLVDRNGMLLAADLVRYGLYLDPRDVSVGREAETRDALLEVMPSLSAQKIDEAFRTRHRIHLASGLTPVQRDAVHDLGRPGVEFQEESRRAYPLGTMGSHLIGFADSGGRGVSGAEKAFDGEIHEAAANGTGPVAVSIDLRVQAALQEELQKASAKFQTLGAMGMVVDVHTGEILALSSLPDYDPNDPGRFPIANQGDQLVSSVYELGSVFKGFTLAAALDSGVANLDTQFDVHAPLQLGAGRPIHDFDKGDTTLSLWQVFTHSSNIGAAKLSLMAGTDRMSRYFKTFGLFNAAPTELGGSARPILPKLDETSTAYMSFGQGISVSPLALATGYTALMNGGTYIPLTIRKSLDGKPVAGRRVVSEATSATLLQLMRMNVNTDPKGSGHKADQPGLRVGGKTGSAQKPEHGHYGLNNVSSFVGRLSDRWRRGGEALSHPDYPRQPARDARQRRLHHRRMECGPDRRGGDRADRALPRRRPDHAADASRRRRRGAALTGKRLSDLLQRPLAVDPVIGGITADSRKAGEGVLFAALPGTSVDGRAFIAQAVSNGAAAVLAPLDTPDLATSAAPLVKVHDVRRAYALAARAFYGAEPDAIVAVTGTNGKTSVATFCRQIFTRCGRKSASMGTLGVQLEHENLTPARPHHAGRRRSRPPRRRSG